MHAPSEISIILDIETLSTQPGALVTEIALIAFRRSDFLILHEREIMPELYEQLAIPRHVCPETIAFHRKNDSLHTNLSSTDSLSDVAFLLEDFFHTFTPQHVWIQGPDFDRPILESLLRQIGRKLPWDFWQTRDTRTLWNLAFPGQKRPKRSHNALEDCRSTLLDMQSAFSALKLDPSAA